MTSFEGPGGGAGGQQGEEDDAPGWGLPSVAPEPPAPTGTSGDDAPLTALQAAVVDEVAEGQRALGDEMRGRRRASLDLLGGGMAGGLLASEVDSALASRAASRVAESERELQFLTDSRDAGPEDEPHFPAGGPPTPEEVHEAEMHPWPHHGMAETIEHNRELHGAPAPTAPQSGPPDAPPGTC